MAALGLQNLQLLRYPQLRASLPPLWSPSPPAEMLINAFAKHGNDIISLMKVLLALLFPAELEMWLKTPSTALNIMN